MTIKELMRKCISQLGSDLQRDARFLLADIAGQSVAFFAINPNAELLPEQLARFKYGLSKLQKGVPLAYVLGNQPFWSLNFLVNEHTLIPRADTEVLVEQALTLGQTLEGVYGESLKVLDLGTGSGIIAICLKHERSNWQVTATDLSNEALEAAQKNAKNNGTDVRFLQGSWFEPITPTEKFNLIVSNPPYIASDDTHLADLTHEPIGALVASNSGLSDIEHIIQKAPGYLCSDGWLLIEHGYNQGDQARGCFMDNGFKHINTTRDYAGAERVTVGQWHI